MKKIKNYIKNFTLKSPCDECLTKPICKEIRCTIEDEYFENKEIVCKLFLNLCQVAVITLGVIMCASWFTYNAMPNYIVFWFNTCQLIYGFFNIRIGLIYKTKSVYFRKRRHIDIEKMEKEAADFRKFFDKVKKNKIMVR